MLKEKCSKLASLIARDVVEALRPLLTGKADNYGSIVDLANEIENAPQKPQNATQMTDGNGNVVTYSPDPSKINTK